MIGKTISHYRIIEKLGEGGMGVVYKAEDTKLKRIVALKFLPQDALNKADEKARFNREAQAAAALQHPSICTIHEIDEVKGQTFIAMEYIAGSDLKSIIAQGPMNLDVAVDIAIRVGRGLREAHEKNVIHRDIKSANIMINDRGRPITLDFGLAKRSGQTALTKEGTSMGTIDYMSPEQAQGDEVDHRTDIWSLGVMLYEMITGQLPFRGEFDQAVVYKIMNEDPEPLTAVRSGVPMDLERLVSKALAKRPDERYQHMSDMLVDLRAVGKQVGATAGARPSSAPKTAVTRTGRSEGVSLVRHLFDRRVPQILGIYVAASFAVIAFLSWLVNRFPLSPHLPDFGLAALASLIPTVVLLAYFHGKSGAAAWSRIEKVGIPINLVASAIILLFVFQGKDLGAATTKVSVTDDEGNVIERIIPKAEHRKRIAIFYFDNKSGDPEHDWIQQGIVEALCYELYQDMYLWVPYGFADELRQKGIDDPTKVPLALKRKITTDEHHDFFLAGTVAADSTDIVFQTTLYDPKSSGVIASREFRGDNIFALADEMSVALRKDLGIPDYHIAESPDLPAAEILTESTEALREFALGSTAHDKNDFALAATHLDRAVDIDPTFAVAHWYRTFTFYHLNREDDMLKAIGSAMEYRYKMPESVQYEAKGLYYQLRQEMDEQFENAKRWATLYPHDTYALGELAELHRQRDERDMAIEVRKRILEADPHAFDQFLEIAALHEDLGQFPEALNYYEEYAKQFPDKSESFERLGRLYRVVGDFDRAMENYKKAVVLEPDRVVLRTAMARLETATGHPDAALAHCDEALKIAKTPRDSLNVLYRLSQICITRGEAQKALEYHEKSRVVRRSYQTPANLLFNALVTTDRYVNAGKTDEAFAIVRDIEANATTSELKGWVNVGYLIIYRTMDNSSYSDEMARRLAQWQAFIEETNNEQWRWSIYFNQGVLDRWSGDRASALGNYQKTLEYLTQDTIRFIRWANIAAAECCRELGMLEQGRAHIEAALTVDPFDPQTNHEAARTYRAMGENDLAEKHLERALFMWENADPQYKPAKEARATAQKWESAVQ
jgi:serine/threonine protein kinase/tetratricopeptide (TPR) repeat protein